ncbi:MAG: efflux transporter outer membrane subunit [Planctomycetota bacterium]
MTQTAGTIGVGLVLSACTVGPDHEPPAFTEVLGESYSPLIGPGTGREDDAEDLAAWWERFDDPALTPLIERALAGSLDLAAARQRVVAARLRRGIANADRLPRLDGEGSYLYTETGDEAIAFNGGPAGTETDLYALGVVAGWEIDLWGRVARLVEAADAEIGFAVEDFRAARVALAAEVARELILIRALDAERATVEAGIVADGDALSIARARADAGFGDELDASRAERVLEENRALLPRIEGDRREAVLRLAVLLGENPTRVVVEPLTDHDDETPLLSGDTSLPVLGVPAELLNRRPDLRRAERSAAAANARIGAAEGDRLPKLTLSGTLTLQGPDAGDVVNPDARFLGLGPGFTVPLFDAGRISNNVKLAESERRQALLAYEQAVVDAVAEVEAAVFRYDRDGARLDRLRTAEDAARRTETLALDRYRAGAADFLSVTDATTQRLAIQRQRIDAERAALVRLTDLYAALGGGWDASANDPRAEAADAADAG